MTSPSPPHLFFFILSFSTIVLFPSVHGDVDDFYTACRNTYDCGDLKNISYPFWWKPTTNPHRPRHCGREGFELTNCTENEHPIITMEDQEFRVLEIRNDSCNITIARADLFVSLCPPRELFSTSLDYDRFSYLPSVRNLTLYYGCEPEYQSVPNTFTCEVAGTDKKTSYFVDDSIARLQPPNRDTCHKNISVPIVWPVVSEGEDATEDALIRVLKQGFPVEYTAEWDLCGPCLLSNGTCGSNEANDKFLCFCGDKPHDRTCTRRGGMHFLLAS